MYYEPGDARGCRRWGLRASPSLAHSTLPRYPRAAEASEEDESRTCIKGSPERNFLGVAVGVGHPGAGRVPSSASHLAAGSESGCLVGGVLRRPSKAISGRVVVGACVLQVGASCPLRSLLVCSRTSSTRVRSYLFFCFWLRLRRLSRKETLNLRRTRKRPPTVITAKGRSMVRTVVVLR